MRVVLTSDIHCRFKQLERLLPEADLLLIAGDLTFCGRPDEIRDLRAAVDRWLQKVGEVILTPGNHDWHMGDQAARAALDNCTILVDELVERQGIKIYGTPWQPDFCDWAYNLPRGPALAAKWALIPEGLDVLLVHGPPRGLGDSSPGVCRDVGCEDLLARLQEMREPPRHVVYGHIHGGYGRYSLGRSQLYNVSFCDEGYKGVNPPVLLELTCQTR